MRLGKRVVPNVLIVLALAAFGGGAYLAVNSHGSKPASTAATSSDNSGAQAAGSATTQGLTDQSKTAPAQDGTPPSQSGQPTTSAPDTPYGAFVSSHTVPLSGSEQSTCGTSLGASCQVVFTKSDDTRVSLPAQAVDSSGSTSWYWQVSKYLSAGTWTVQAVATKGGQTAMATDTIKLTVQP